MVMLGHVGIIVPRRIMEGKATPSGPPRTFSVMLGRVEVTMVLLSWGCHLNQVWGPSAKGPWLQNFPGAKDRLADTWEKFQTLSP